ncbi:hypothetical protein N0V83_002012 [Neocucurbitaria cava]|uniref:BTB domain-containing protein n=1 Tax=Neocucurbitaria cava TaxID=798079 RepID=A0A9W9CQI6_9PLEO|nr:hypothetical protein N0V83_002012 [Neocucurbitaria cava]
MFVTPVFVSRNVLDPSIYASKRSSCNGFPEASRRFSIASSDASIDLHRTSSTNSNNSTSTNASSIAPTSPTQRPHHRKAFSGSSIHVPRRFQKKLQKSQPQEQQPLKQAPPRPPPPPPPPPKPPKPQEPVSIPAPAVSIPAPVVTSSSTRTADWQCSDLVVRCKNDVYHVDRVIMCYHSRWFAKVCAVVISPKSSKSVIDLSADDPDAVAAMMQYCYQLDYTDRLSGSDTTVPEDITLRSHVDVFMLAERYGVSGLKQVALQKFEDLAGMVLMVDGNEEQLLQAIRAMYASDRRSNADDLRQVAVKMCADHVESFISGTERTMALVFESMDELPEFRTDLFEEMASRWK